jgi:hypothetical protein
MTGLLLRLITATLLWAAMAGAAAADPMGQSEPSVDRPGGDYHSYKSDNLSQCATSCATVAQCRAYTYVPATGICWMKNIVPQRFANNCCTSGIKIMGAMEMGTDRPGSDLRPGFDVATPSSCERACRQDGNCRAYTFVKPGVQGPGARCWLKSTAPARVANSCCVSGVRLVNPARRQDLPATRID